MSDDGIHFEKFAMNPIVKNFSGEASEDFRDPKVWIYENNWYMIVGTSKNQDGRAVLYRSTDGLIWTYQSVVATSNGQLGDFWECPDLFTVNEQDFLMISSMQIEGAKNVFLVGQFDYQTGVFEREKILPVDYGRDFYAGQTFLDECGRRILIGWMSVWGEPSHTHKEGWV